MEVLKGIIAEPPDLGGYLGLNDSIVHLILNSEERYEMEDSKTVRKEDREEQIKLFLKASSI